MQQFKRLLPFHNPTFPQVEIKQNKVGVNIADHFLVSISKTFLITLSLLPSISTALGTYLHFSIMNLTYCYEGVLPIAPS